MHIDILSFDYVLFYYVSQSHILIPRYLRLAKYYPNATEEELDFIAEEAGYFHSIMLRENGIINLNFYGAYEDCFYITFAVTETTSEIIDCGRGFYLPAAVEAIATYPAEEEAE